MEKLKRGYIGPKFGIFHMYIGEHSRWQKWDSTSQTFSIQIIMKLNFVNWNEE